MDEEEDKIVDVHSLAYQNRPKDERSEYKKKLCDETREFYIKRQLRPRYGRRIYR